MTVITTGVATSILPQLVCGTSFFSSSGICVFIFDEQVCRAGSIHNRVPSASLQTSPSDATGHHHRSAGGLRPQRVREEGGSKHEFAIPQSKPLRAGTARAPVVTAPGWVRSLLTMKTSIARVRRSFQHHARLSKMNEILKNDFIIAHTICLARSLKHWTGRELQPGVSDASELERKV